jgi:hypothetical protein
MVVFEIDDEMRLRANAKDESKEVSARVLQCIVIQMPEMSYTVKIQTRRF